MLRELLLAKFLESSWLVYVNIRQWIWVGRVGVSHPILTQPLLSAARRQARRRVMFDVFKTTIELIIFSAVCCEVFMPGLWVTCQKWAWQDEILASIYFTLFLCIWFWLLHSLPISFLQKFLLEKKCIDRQWLWEWLWWAVGNLMGSINDHVCLSALVVVLPTVTEDPALALSLIAATHKTAMYLHARRSHPRTGVFAQLPNSKLKQRLAIVASLLGFASYQVFLADEWAYGGEWSAKLEGEPVPLDSVHSLVVTHYREESGGGHAKSFDVPEIMAFAAHCLSFGKYWHPVVMSVLDTVFTVVKLQLSYFLLSNGDTWSELGFTKNNKPVVVMLFLNFYLFLFILNSVRRWLVLCVSRWYHEAGDRLVVWLGLGRHLASALLKLQARKTANPTLDPVYSSFYSSCPSLSSRLPLLTTMLNLI